MNAKLPEERTVFKIVVPLRIERICLRPDLDVPLDSGLGWFHQLQPNGFPLQRPLASVCRKRPFSSSQRVPVFAGDTPERFAGMSAFGPLPECLPQSPFHPLERLPCHDVTMVVHPATNDRIELPYQVGLAHSPVLANQLPCLFQKDMRVLLGWADNQLAVKLTEMLSEEVEPLGF